MPNHVANIIIVDSKMEEISNKLYTTKGKEADEEIFVDFGNIIPMPEELRGAVSPSRKAENESEEQHNERINNLIEKYGHSSWYDWNCANWGTKWNAYHSIVGRDSFEFQTAWSHPFPFMEQLSNTFPTVRFEVKYADEDIEQNIGSYVMENGDIVEDNVPIGEMACLQFACDIWGEDINERLSAELEEEGSYNVEI